MINKEEFEKCSVKENLGFVKKVLSLATHNAFTKDDLLFLIKWQNAIIEKMKYCSNCKSFEITEDYRKCRDECAKKENGRWILTKWELAE